jgi:hypothetical protein
MLPLHSADKLKTFDTDKDGLNPNAKTFSRKDAKSQRKSSPIFGLIQDSNASDVLCALCGSVWPSSWPLREMPLLLTRVVTW